jgi:hypothetical protein
MLIFFVFLVFTFVYFFFKRKVIESNHNYNWIRLTDSLIFRGNIHDLQEKFKKEFIHCRLEFSENCTVKSVESMYIGKKDSILVLYVLEQDINKANIILNKLEKNGS